MKLYPTTIQHRFWALVLDVIFMYLIAIFIGVIAALLSSMGMPDWLGITFVVVIALLYIFYLPLFETLNHGQTLGKQILGIRVVRTDGSPASGVHCLQRYMLMPLDLIMTMGIGGLVSAMVTEKRQRLGDLFADTMVVDSMPHRKKFNELIGNQPANQAEERIIARINPHINFKYVKPLELAKMYRDVECDIARLRTHKSSPWLIDYMSRLLSGVHLALFKKKGYSVKDLFIFIVRSIPQAVYESRWCILGALAMAVISYVLGVYSQYQDPDFFRQILGTGYADMTLENIRSGNPMGVYGSQDEFEMFMGIFMNNFLVSLRIYAMGVFVLVGPLYYALINFMMIGTFDAFFAQQGLLQDALITPNEHGIIELSTIVMVLGAALRLGTGWIFPGKLSRLKALSRGARQSMLILISSAPMLLIAAFIEGFVSRHTEWPMVIKLSIIILTSILILTYYVMLPFYAKRK